MTKYSVEIKLEAVRAYLAGKESYRAIAKKYQVSRTPLQTWVANYQKHGVKAFEKIYTNYTAEYKMDVLHFMSETGASAIEAAAVFNIPSTNTIYCWQNLYKEQGFDALQSKKKGRLTLTKKEKKKPLRSTEESWLERIKYLEMENAYLKKLNALVQSKEKSQNKTK